MSRLQHYLEMAVNFKESDKRKNMAASVAKSLINKFNRAAIKESFKLLDSGSFSTSKKKAKIVFSIDDDSEVGVAKSIIELFGKDNKDFDFDVTIVRHDVGSKFTVVIKKLEEPSKDNVDITQKK